MGRQTSTRYVKIPPHNFYFPTEKEDTIVDDFVGLTIAEFEAMRLKHYIELNQKDSAENMNVSQPTFSRILEKAHKKVIETARIKGTEEALKENGVVKLISTLKVANSLPIGRVAKILEMNEDIIWDKAIEWSQEFGFTINGDQLDFTGGKKEEFITKLKNSNAM